MIKLFVYGTLKKGFSAHSFMKECVFIKEARTTSDYSLYRISWFPTLVLEPSENGVKGELYNVPEECFKALDRYEGAPDLFKRIEITLDDGSFALSYLYNSSLGEAAKVETGEWTKDEYRILPSKKI